jgi:hypothetical protein
VLLRERAELGEDGGGKAGDAGGEAHGAQSSAGWGAIGYGLPMKWIIIAIVVAVVVMRFRAGNRPKG